MIVSKERAIASTADFSLLTEQILILPQSILVYNPHEYGMFLLYSLSGVHQAAILVSALFMHNTWLHDLAC